MNAVSQPPPIALTGPKGGLSVEFSWVGDRYHHRIYREGRVVAEGREGTAQDTWPASGPLQQISLEVIDGRSLILGVGAAGQSHWSVSVEICREGDAQGVEFDWACRTGATPTFLGSSYQNLDGLLCQPLGDAIVETPGDRRARIVPPVGCPPESTAAGKARSNSTTGRWRYRLVPV